MFRFKKTVSIILAVTLVFGLTACSGDAGESVNVKVDVKTGDHIDVKTDVKVDTNVDVKTDTNIVVNANKGNAPLNTVKLPEFPQYPEVNEMDYYKLSTEEQNAKMTEYNDLMNKWYDRMNEIRSNEDGFDNALNGFYKKSIAEFLGEGEGNKVYSPINVYLAFAMLAETCDGETQKQLLDLFGVKDLNELRALSQTMWDTQYIDDGVSKLLLANSVWLRNDSEYNKEVLDNLAEYYYSEAYAGSMGTSEYNKMLQGWLNDNTNHLLEDSAAQVEMSRDTFLTLASTIYFKRQWADEFTEAATRDEIFTQADKTEIKVPFMNKKSRNTVYYGKGFKALSLRFRNGNQMWLLLPDEGMTPEELVQKVDVAAYIRGDISWQKTVSGEVELHLPKFDVQSDMELIDGLGKLGITSAFAPGADFTPLNKDFEGYVNEVLHSGRVIIDEEGCEAAAFTVIMMKATAMMPDPEPIEFRLDRPFFFAVTGELDVPLFTGIVNEF